MKKFSFVFGIIAMIMFAFGFSACEKESALQSSENYSENVETGSEKGTLIVNDCGAQIKPGETQPFPGEPVHGLPGVTTYKFFVANPSSDVIGVDIYFTAPDQNVYIHSMQQNAAGNWYYENPLSQSGHYTMKYYLYTSSGSTIIKTPTPSYVDNTYVHYSSNKLKSHWPFGSDGSTNTNRTVYINGQAQTWVYYNSHDSNDPKWRYSQDWNRGSSYDDYNVPVRSPLDGVIVNYGTTSPYFPNTGWSNYVIVEQTIGTTKYQFFVAHLDHFGNIYNGKYVTKNDTIGYIGDTGTNNQCHAHTTMWVPTKVSIDFDFSADD